MSDQNIKVGDRCEVVKWPCCGVYLGHTMLITTLFVSGLKCKNGCTKCGGIIPVSGVFGEDHTQPENQGLLCSAPVEWLRKLPDLTEPETTETVIFDKKPETV